MADLITKGPKLDWTQDRSLYSWFLDWKEECNLILGGPLKKKSPEEKSNFIRLWADKVGRKHINSLKASETNLKKPDWILQRLEEYCKPKSNTLLAATELKRLSQGDMSLPEFITKATLLVEACDYPATARDRILRDAIVIGIKSEKAYYKCVEKGSSLTLEEALQIVQSEDSTQRQVESCRQQTQVQTETDVHKLRAKQSQGYGGARQKKQGQPKSQDHGKKSCFMCGAQWHPCKECPAKNAKCFKCEKVGHYGQQCRSKKNKQLHELQAELNKLKIQQQHQAQTPVQQYEFVDCIPSMGFPPAKPLNTLQTVKVQTINCTQNVQHIRPAWISVEPNSQLQKVNCKVDTRAGCNVMPYNLLQSAFRNVKLEPATVRIIAYDNNAVEVLGSCILHAHTDSKVYRLECQVTKTEGHFILGRDTAVKMKYVAFPEIKPPKISLKTIVSAPAVSQESTTVNVDAIRSHKTKKTEHTVASKQGDLELRRGNLELQSDLELQNRSDLELHSPQPVKPTVSCSTNSVTLNGKKHSLPTTKEYLLEEYKDVFSGIGTLPGGPYHIQLKKDYKAVQHAPRQVAVSLKSAYKAELQRLLKEGIITEEHGHTEWINSIVPVKKPDGSLRLCLDPKDLNKAIKRNQWYSRTIDDVLPELTNTEVVSMTDANSGYQQVALDLASSLLTTFNTPWGKFRFLKLPFGLMVASDVFQERLDKVTRLVQGVISIADDILIPGKLADHDHDIRLLTLLETAKMNNLTLNAKKFVFKSTDCPFFGHSLTPEGLKIDPKKVEAIVSMEAPTNLKDLQSFLGLVKYLNRYSPGLAQIAEPLQRLCKKDTVYAWESQQQEAFKAIKAIITTAPVLAYFDKEKKHNIQTDASKKGLGAVLLQDGQPVIYASRSLTPAESQYSNIERELLAVVFALERLHHYVYGYTVTVETDHKPLVSIWHKTISAASPRLQRLLLRLAQYDLDIVYLKGRKNVIADALSRVSPQKRTDEESEHLDLIPVHYITSTIPADADKLQEFRAATQNDRVLSLLMHEVYHGWPQVRSDCHPLLLEYWNYRDDISLEDGLLFKGHRLIIPESLREECLKTIHEGHYGVEKSQLRAREAVFWPRITQDITREVQSCETCQVYAKSQPRETLQQHEVPAQPWIKLGADLFELKSTHYLLVADYYSRFPVIRRLSGLSTQSVINQLKSIFSEYGIPAQVMSDNGPQFASAEFREFSGQYKFQHITSSPCYAQSNGFIERMVQTVKMSMKKCLASGHDFNLAMLVYRATPQSSRLPSPAEMLNSRKFRALLPMRSPQTVHQREAVLEQMLQQQVKQSAHHDKSARDLPPLHTNQPVYVQRDPKSLWESAVITEVHLRLQIKVLHSADHRWISTSPQQEVHKAKCCPTAPGRGTRDYPSFTRGYHSSSREATAQCSQTQKTGRRNLVCAHFSIGTFIAVKWILYKTTTQSV